MGRYNVKNFTITLLTLRDLKLQPKACNLAIRRSYFRQSNAFDKSVRAAVHFVHEFLSFSQSCLRDNHCVKGSKYGPEKTPYLDTFHTVNVTHYSLPKAHCGSRKNSSKCIYIWSYKSLA